MATTTAVSTKCCHCGEDCDSSKIGFDESSFCCDGCKNDLAVVKQDWIM